MKASQFTPGCRSPINPAGMLSDLVCEKSKGFLGKTVRLRQIEFSRLMLGKIRPCAVTLFLIAVLLMGCGGGPRSYLHPKADFTFIKKVAVLPLENFSSDKFAGDKIRDIVITEVLSRGFFDVVEWGEVSRVLREEGKGATTSLNKETVKRVGTRLGIQALILGSVEEYGAPQGRGRDDPMVAITMRMIDTRTSKILWQASYDAEGGGTLNQLFGVKGKSISEVARKLVKEMMGTLFGGSGKKIEKKKKKEKKAKEEEKTKEEEKAKKIIEKKEDIV